MPSRPRLAHPTSPPRLRRAYTGVQRTKQTKGYKEAPSREAPPSPPPHHLATKPLNPATKPSK